MTRLRTAAFCLALLAPCVPSVPQPATASVLPVAATLAAQTTIVVTLPSGRTYRLRSPTVPSGPQPLIVALHGAGQSSTVWEPFTGITPWADQHDITVAYGEGIGARWNSGPRCCDVPPGQVSTRDDVTYLRQVVADAGSRTPIDAGRVYAAGGSNGGAMAFRLACEAPDLIAGALVVAGWLDVPCPTNVAVLHIHGQDDASVRYWGCAATAPCFEGRLLPGVAGEARRVLRGSLYEFMPSAGGHIWPGWAMPQGWAFLAPLRLP
jgi:polyhydroxybutyrate depolymerase